MSPDRIQLGRAGEESQSAPRQAVGLVGESTDLRNRAPAEQTITVFGPDRALVERWSVMRPFSSRRVMRAFTQAGYPWIRQISAAAGVRSTRRSPTAPAWADEVFRP